MTLDEMRTRVLLYLDNRGDITSTLTDAVINENYKFLASPFRFHEQEYTETFTTAADDPDYVIANTFMEVLSVFDETNERGLKQRDIVWYDQQDLTDTGQPEYWVPWSTNTILLYPTPDDAYDIRARTRRLPATLTTGQSPLMPEDWHRVIVLMAASDLAFLKKQRELGMLLRNEALGHLTTREEALTKEARNQEYAGFTVKRPRL